MRRCVRPSIGRTAKSSSGSIRPSASPCSGWKADGRTAEEARHVPVPVPMEEAPLLRAAWIRLAEGEAALQLDVHHIRLRRNVAEPAGGGIGALYAGRALPVQTLLTKITPNGRRIGRAGSRKRERRMAADAEGELRLLSCRPTSAAADADLRGGHRRAALPGRCRRAEEARFGTGGQRSIWHCSPCTICCWPLMRTRRILSSAVPSRRARIPIWNG